MDLDALLRVSFALEELDDLLVRAFVVDAPDLRLPQRRDHVSGLGLCCRLPMDLAVLQVLVVGEQVRRSFYWDEAGHAASVSHEEVTGGIHRMWLHVAPSWPNAQGKRCRSTLGAERTNTSHAFGILMACIGVRLTAQLGDFLGASEAIAFAHFLGLTAGLGFDGL